MRKKCTFPFHLDLLFPQYLISYRIMLNILEPTMTIYESLTSLHSENTNAFSPKDQKP